MASSHALDRVVTVQSRRQASDRRGESRGGRREADKTDESPA
jgi:hypothetical protein